MMNQRFYYLMVFMCFGYGMVSIYVSGMSNGAIISLLLSGGLLVMRACKVCYCDICQYINHTNDMGKRDTFYNHQ